MSSTAVAPRHARAFRHETLVYEGPAELIDRLTAFVLDGVAADERVLVALAPAKLELLRDRVEDSERVHYVDMHELGRNPGRIIPAWRDFVAHHGDGGLLRGVGEPVWAGRTPEELDEAVRHEALLNVAGGDLGGLWLVCPYDASGLRPEVLAHAERTHSHAHGGAAALAGGLPDLGEPDRQLTFGLSELSDVRNALREDALAAGLPARRSDLLVLAVNELTSNSLRHGGGDGQLLVWHQDDALIAEVRDSGHIQDPLVGRATPSIEQPGGRGIWLVHQVCDLVQVRSEPGCTTIRVRMAR